MEQSTGRIDLHEFFAGALSMKATVNLPTFIKQKQQKYQVWAKHDLIADFLSSVQAELYSDEPLPFSRFEKGMQALLNARANKIICLMDQKEDEKLRVWNDLMPGFADILGDKWSVSRLSQTQRNFAEELVVGLKVIDDYSEKIEEISAQIKCFGEWLLSDEYQVLKENYNAFRLQRLQISRAFTI